MKRYLSIILAAATVAAAGKADESGATKLLKERTEHLRRLVTKVSPSVYCASGYSPANISMIIGTDGLVIVDTGMLPAHAEEVFVEFRKITDLPVKAIILTHGHGDHTGGTAAFLEDGVAQPAIFSRTPFNSEGNHFEDGGITINGLRGARQGDTGRRPFCEQNPNSEARVDRKKAASWLAAADPDSRRNSCCTKHREIRRTRRSLPMISQFLAEIPATSPEGILERKE